MRIAAGGAGAESIGDILMITVFLADDHPIVRQGLRALLEADGRCQVVGEATDGLTAIEELIRLQPQVAILDVQLPDLNGLEVARRAQAQAPNTRIIMLSMYADEPYVLDALRHGAAGYVLKGTSTDDLRAALDAVMAGRRYLSAPLNDRAIDAYSLRAAAVEQPLDRYDLLTSREREVLQLAAQGFPTQRLVSGSPSAPALPRPIVPTCCASWACRRKPTWCGSRYPVASYRPAPPLVISGTHARLRSSTGREHGKYGERAWKARSGPDGRDAAHLLQ